MTTRPTTIIDVIRDLRVGAYVEDWGIINADASRLGEFVEYLVVNATRMEDDVQGELLELVLASAEDAAREHGRTEQAAGQIARALAACGRGNLVRLTLDYWERYWRKQADDGLALLIAELSRPE